MSLPRTLLLFAVMALLVQGGLYWAYHLYLHDYRLSLVPDALEIKEVRYAVEKSWGFGPGGNETGFILYDLPQPTANAAESGLSFFTNLPDNPLDRRRDWRGSYTNWQRTPVRAEPQHWPQNAEIGALRARDYLCRYGFCIAVKPALLKQVDNLLNSPGSYYAYGRIGLIIVSPQQRLVVYMYNG